MRILINGNLYKSKYDDLERKYKNYAENIQYSHVLYGKIINYTIGKYVKDDQKFKLSIHFDHYGASEGTMRDLYIEMESYTCESTENIAKYLLHDVLHHDLDQHLIELTQLNDKGTLWDFRIDNYICAHNCKLDFGVTVIMDGGEELTYRPVVIDDTED